VTAFYLANEYNESSDILLTWGCVRQEVQHRAGLCWRLHCVLDADIGLDWTVVVIIIIIERRKFIMHT